MSKQDGVRVLLADPSRLPVRVLRVRAVQAGGGGRAMRLDGCAGCYISPEGDYWCAKFGGWHMECPAVRHERMERGEDLDEDESENESEAK